MTLSYPTSISFTKMVAFSRPRAGPIIPSLALSGASFDPCKLADMKWGELPSSLQIRLIDSQGM
jgi:hypothetical protein